MRYFTLLFLIFFNNLLFSQDFKWGKRLGNGSSDVCEKTAIDKDGNIYTTGWFRYITYGSSSITALGSFVDVFLSKHDSLGNLLWIKRGGCSGNDFGYALAIDDSGNCIIAGQISVGSVADFGSFTFTSSGQADIFIAKYDSSGNCKWAQKAGGTFDDIAYGLDTDSSGNILLTGRCSSTSTFGSQSTPAGAFLAKYSPSGTVIWVSSFGNSADTGNDVKLDSFGNAYITGLFQGTAYFDAIPLVSSGQSDAFLAKIDPNGNVIWANAFSGVQGEVGLNVDLDSQENVIISGYFYQTVDFGCSSLVNSSSGYEPFIAKYSPNGTCFWNKKMTGTNGAWPEDMVLDQNDNIYLTGWFKNKLMAGNFSIQAVGTTQDDIYVAKLDANGDALGLFSVGSSTGNDLAHSLAVDSQGDIVVVGEFVGTVDFDPSASTSNLVSFNGTTDLFIVRYGQNQCGFLGVSYTINPLTCTNNGTVKATAQGGMEPYIYAWSTNPITLDSTLTIINAGWYDLTISYFNCTQTRSVYMNGPSTQLIDLNTNLVSTDLITNFHAQIRINALNSGCTAQNGNLYVVKDTAFVIDSIVPMPNSINGDTMIWNFTGLNFDSPNITPIIYGKPSINVGFGDTATFQTFITPYLNDIDTLNNFKSYRIPIRSSYDPNDKNVYPKGTGPNGNIKNNLTMTYTVRFQNTGNAPAVNVVIADTLDNNLDMSTLRLVGNSHPMILESLSANVLNFRFDNIMLPDSFSNEPQSHGYVIFEIDQKPNLTNGTTLSNQAAIYFDFNPPIFTNTTLNTIESLITHSENKEKFGIQVFPNPFSDFLMIESNTELRDIQLVLLNSLGQKIVVSEKLNGKRFKLENKNLQNGLYFLQIIQNQQIIKTEKVIME